MSEQTELDLPTAHRYFSAACFNAAWKMIDKPIRTPAEDEQMLLRAMASFYHWTQRPEVNTTNRSVSLWQISRVYALLGQPENALRYARQCLAESQAASLPPFFIGYGYEALARAEKLSGNETGWREAQAAALAACEQVTEVEDREVLLADLKTL
jgi:hypothetical protein